MAANVDKDFAKNRAKAMTLLQEEASLQEIVRLVGRDSLSYEDQLKLEATKSIREDYLQQNAFHDIDTFCSHAKQNKMLKLVLQFYDLGMKALEHGVYLKDIEKLEVREKIARSKYIDEQELEKIDEISVELDSAFEKLIQEGGILDA